MNYRFWFSSRDYTRQQTRLTQSWNICFQLAIAITIPFLVPTLAVASSPIEEQITTENRINFQNLSVEPQEGEELNSALGSSIQETSETFPLIVQATNDSENLQNLPLSEIIESGKIPTTQPRSTEQRNSQNLPNSIQIETSPENSIPIPILPAPNNTSPSDTFNTQRRELRDLLNLEPSPLPNVRGDNISLNDFPDLPTIQRSVFQPPISNPLDITDPNVTPETSQYKVIVETRNSGQEAIVRSLVPSAFRIVYNGRPMMQVGLFDNIENAQEIIRTFNRSGLQGIIVPQ